MNRAEPVPAALDPAREPQPYLARIKARLAKRLSFTRASDLNDAASLALYLAALGRADEAVAVADHLASNVAFAGNYQLWGSVALALVVRARLQRQAGENALAEQALDRLRAHPGFAAMGAAAIDAECRKAEAYINKGLAERAQGRACMRLAAGLGTLMYFRETAAPGFAHADAYPTAPLDAAIERGLAGLRARLG